MTLKLLKLLSKNARLKDEELAVMTGADEKEVHNNIAEMEKEGLLKRVHGGASYLSFETRILPFDLRHKSMVKEKMRLKN